MKPASDEDLGFAFFCAAFAIILGLSLGVVLGYSDPGVTTAAQSHFEASAVSQTAAVGQEILAESPTGQVLAPAFFVVLLIVNNLIVAGLIAFNHRFLIPVQSIIITSGALFFNGFIAGAILIREISMVGFVSIMSTIGLYWGFEMAAYVIAGAIGYYAIMHGRQSFDGNGIFIGWVFSLLAIGGGVEALILVGPSSFL